MCQIISTEYLNKTHAQANLIPVEIDDIIETLDVKGSDEYSFFCYGARSNIEPLIIRSDNINKFRLELKVIGDYLELLNDSENIGVVWFSRQKPEEEDSKINLPPYYNKRLDTWYWIHGTISNDNEILSDLRERERRDKFFGELLTITVDTEIFKYLRDEDFSRLKGLYTYFELNWKFKVNGVSAYDKGMGLWQKDNHPYKTMQCSPFDNTKFQVLPDSPNTRIDNISVAFSGGMDITLNTYKVLDELVQRNKNSIVGNLNNQKITLNYFNYGTNASEAEIQTCYKLLDLFQADFPSLNISFEIIDMSDIINGIARVSGEYLKITDKDAVGDTKETEENISYVPYRNTLFCIALNAKLQKEADKNDNNFIVLGLNLSEGMVFGDNNSAWVECTEKMLSYGGKFYQDIKIISPYLNRTKTNTLKEFGLEFGLAKLQQLLDLSFSCYYPKEGKECGECGSCILRNKAIKTLKIKGIK